MRILVGKTFGIGNVLLSVPLLKALRLLGHRADVLIGTGPDDAGADETLRYFFENHGLSPQTIYHDRVPYGIDHDLAIMAIPFDGRWMNGIHFRADRVMDGRRRPGNIDRLGFDMWEKHEVEYQMENARELGLIGPTPDGSIDEVIRTPKDFDRVYVGIGYKRDPGGFGLSKHFGTARYLQLMEAIRAIRPTTRFVSTGTVQDWIQVGAPLMKQSLAGDKPFFFCKAAPLAESITVLRDSAAYLGNDTGMMHMAAALGLRTFGLFAYKDLLVKNPPYTHRGRALLFAPECPPIDEIAEQFVDFIWG